MTPTLPVSTRHHRPGRGKQGPDARLSSASWAKPPCSRSGWSFSPAEARPFSGRSRRWARASFSTSSFTISQHRRRGSPDRRPQRRPDDDDSRLGREIDDGPGRGSGGRGSGQEGISPAGPSGRDDSDQPAKRLASVGMTPDAARVLRLAALARRRGSPASSLGQGDRNRRRSRTGILDRHAGHPPGRRLRPGSKRVFGAGQARWPADPIISSSGGRSHRRPPRPRRSRPLSVSSKPAYKAGAAPKGEHAAIDQRPITSQRTTR